ncbi:Na+/H+ antiporter NhaC [Xenorhabdus khoisanae]|uniref:Na+/H+ antiporter NhaC n=1 Tax=Xenorhabdus khoisanae TaxID=880157 RepID=UPI0023598A20|nr:Na+/H+ antiporter NhaC [Xenorhabdus khoisanae]MDC9613608.1 Na+/H+ antiporter NhaC [Xenorhabdus khoisanae]
MDDKKKLNLGLSILPIAAMLLLLIIGYGQLDLRIESLLLISAAIAAVLAYWQGYRWDSIIDSIVAKLTKAMPVIMILICVGGLIGTWMFSGTIPYMVYWGLKLISPQYILIAAFFITSVISVCTGTSWGSAGTVGVALMGVAAGLDVSLAAAAGAIVSGAYFGDKISPLSDSTNFAAIVADTDLYSHIRHLMYTTIPGFVLASIVYFIAGHTSLTNSSSTPEKITEIIQSLENLYHFNLLLILPPMLVLWGAMTKRPVIPVMLTACTLAIAIGIGVQGFTLKQGLNALIDGFNLSMFSDQGHNITGVVNDVPRLLNRGGMSSMMNTVLLVFCAFSFAGILTLTGALTIIINQLLRAVHTTGQLIAATLGTTILVTGATCDGKLALLIPAELFKDAYRRMGLDNKNLSRTIEDGCTVIEPLLPWTSAGIYMATTLGVSTLDLLPWAIQCYAAVFFALIYGFTGFGIAKIMPETMPETTPESSLKKKEIQRETM